MEESSASSKPILEVLQENEFQNRPRNPAIIARTKWPNFAPPITFRKNDPSHFRVTISRYTVCSLSNINIPRLCFHWLLNYHQFLEVDIIACCSVFSSVVSYILEGCFWKHHWIKHLKIPKPLNNLYFFYVQKPSLGAAKLKLKGLEVLA